MTERTLPALEQADCSKPGQHRPVYVPVEDDDEGPLYGPLPCPYCTLENEKSRARSMRAGDLHRLHRMVRREEHRGETGEELPVVADRPRGPGRGPQEALRCRPIRERLITLLREAVAVWSTVPGAEVVTGTATVPGIVDDGHLVIWDRSENGTVVVVRQSDLPDCVGKWPEHALPELCDWEKELR